MTQGREYYFVIVGHNDQPIFEMEFPPCDPKKKREPDTRHLNQFIAHAALDIIDEQIITNSQMYLKVISFYRTCFLNLTDKRLSLYHSQSLDCLHLENTTCHLTVLLKFYRIWNDFARRNAAR